MKFFEKPNTDGGPRKVLVITERNVTRNTEDDTHVERNRKDGKIVVEVNGEDFELHRGPKPSTSHNGERRSKLEKKGKVHNLHFWFYAWGMQKFWGEIVL